MTADLFADESTENISPAVSYHRNFLSDKQQQSLLAEVAHYPLEKIQIEVFGKRHFIPRTQAWFGDIGCQYRYSKTLISPLPWPRFLGKLRQKLAVDYALDFNAVLVNHYADGRESMGWHSDDEAEIEPNSVIASVTLGACRDFVLRHNATQQKFSFALQSGDLLIMHAGMQQAWQHCVPKRLKVLEPRINFTFRKIIPNFYS